jgi:hypothetical protein
LLVVVPDGWLLCGGVGLFDPIAAANSGVPEMAIARRVGTTNDVLRTVPPLVAIKSQLSLASQASSNFQTKQMELQITIKSRSDR